MIDDLYDAVRELEQERRGVDDRPWENEVPVGVEAGRREPSDEGSPRELVPVCSFCWRGLEPEGVCYFCDVGCSRCGGRLDSDYFCSVCGKTSPPTAAQPTLTVSA